MVPVSHKKVLSMEFSNSRAYTGIKNGMTLYYLNVIDYEPAGLTVHPPPK